MTNEERARRQARFESWDGIRWHPKSELTKYETDHFSEGQYVSTAVEYAFRAWCAAEQRGWERGRDEAKKECIEQARQYAQDGTRSGPTNGLTSRVCALKISRLTYKEAEDE